MCHVQMDMRVLNVYNTIISSSMLMGRMLTFIKHQAIVILESTKGHKDALNEHFVHYARPLDDTESQHICPISWLLIHVLRNGLVLGTTLPEAFQCS